MCDQGHQGPCGGCNSDPCQCEMKPSVFQRTLARVARIASLLPQFPPSMFIPPAPPYPYLEIKYARRLYLELASAKNEIDRLRKENAGMIRALGTIDFFVVRVLADGQFAVGVKEPAMAVRWWRKNNNLIAACRNFVETGEAKP